jgi:hypothetical protein
MVTTGRASAFSNALRVAACSCANASTCAIEKRAGSFKVYCPPLNTNLILYKITSLRDCAKRLTLLQSYRKKPPKSSKGGVIAHSASGTMCQVRREYRQTHQLALNYPTRLAGLFPLRQYCRLCPLHHLRAWEYCHCA